MGLVMAIVYFASFDIVPVIARALVQPEIACIGDVPAFRWAIRDQMGPPGCLLARAVSLIDT